MNRYVLALALGWVVGCSTPTAPSGYISSARLMTQAARPADFFTVKLTIHVQTQSGAPAFGASVSSSDAAATYGTNQRGDVTVWIRQGLTAAVVTAIYGACRAVAIAQAKEKTIMVLSC